MNLRLRYYTVSAVLYNVRDITCTSGQEASGLKYLLRSHWRILSGGMGGRMGDLEELPALHGVKFDSVGFLRQTYLKIFRSLTFGL